MAKIKFWSVGGEGHGGYPERSFDNVVEMLKEMQSGDDPYMVPLPTPYPMLISMGYYILLFVIIMILTIIKVIPLVSSILGGLIGISYFSTALHDYMLWRKKYGK